MLPLQVISGDASAAPSFAFIRAPLRMADAAHLSQTAFSELPLAEPVQAALAEIGFSHCTPIQAQTLPKLIAGRDIAGQAQTGTGKTAAFLLATIHRLLSQEPKPIPKGFTCAPRALIIAPTRELAIQIEKDAATLLKHVELSLMVVFGGTGYESQREELRAGIDILVGTPGRLIDYYKQKAYTLDHAEAVVLDEADRMFDLGFLKDIRYLLRKLPKPEQRLNMLFSATLSHRVLELAYEHMNDPELVRVEAETVTADRVRQTMLHVSKDDKIALLIGWLRRHDPHRTMVFINTKRVGERVADWLNANGFSAAIISGDVPQTKRMRLLERFQQGELSILVATDVAARGLHIPDVTHVINYDLPQDAEDYVHRIGRTARAGAEGDAISFCCEEYVYSLPDIERYVGFKIETDIPSPDDMASDLTRPKPRPRKPRADGRRRSGGGGGGGRRRGGPRSGGGR